MLPLIAGLVLFLGIHAVTMRRGTRAALIERFGAGPYKLGYSVVALIGLVLVSYGFGLYRREGWIDVWYPPLWTRHLALLLVWPAFVFFVAAYLPGRIKRVLKHPMLAAVKLWALAHLLANGDLGSILLFGSILAWAVAARISLKRRADAVDLAPGPPQLWADLAAFGIGTAAWFVFARWLHPMLIGVSVWPGQ
ncbi:NnrU family protein [Enterovirga rhinocerotis]|uniref:Putative membrane protein n=1 Tax=Enterovirga rhinocerotis TaxID=1339210 RepID=A0A4R7C9S6_9HYPH|nr:NnrU family protein [Enterovirga rhinocerotis]TDR93696.1 putative membrane protein [Enterovirga rhinocerotis]